MKFINPNSINMILVKENPCHNLELYDRFTASAINFLLILIREHLLTTLAASHSLLLLLSQLSRRQFLLLLWRINQIAERITLLRFIGFLGQSGSSTLAL